MRKLNFQNHEVEDLELTYAMMAMDEHFNYDLKRSPNSFQKTLLHSLLKDVPMFNCLNNNSYLCSNMNKFSRNTISLAINPVKHFTDEKLKLNFSSDDLFAIEDELLRLSVVPFFFWFDKVQKTIMLLSRIDYYFSESKYMITFASPDETNASDWSAIIGLDSEAEMRSIDVVVDGK